MKDESKTKRQLIAELNELRRRVSASEVGMTDSDRKRAEAALRASEERFRRVFVEGPCGIILLGPDGRIQQANPRICRRLGYSEEEMVTLGVDGISHPDDLEPDLELGSRLGRGEIPHYSITKRYLCKDGEVFWGQLTVSAMHDAEGGPPMSIRMIEDITERRKAEEALRESEERFQAFMEHSPAIAWMKDEEGRHVYLSKSYEKRFGVRLEDWQGKTDFELWPLETAEQFWKNDQAVLEGGRVVEVIEEISDPDGERCYWWSFKFPFQDASGNRHVGGIGVDITERKRAEAMLSQAHDELEQRVKERTAELTAANQALRQSEEKHRVLVDTSPDGVLMTDLEGRVLFASERVREMHGSDRVEDLLGRNPFEFVAPEDHQRFLANLARTLEEGITRSIEYSFLRRDGTYLAGEVSAAVVRDTSGQPRALVAVLRDITQRKQAQEALQHAYDELRAVYEGMSDGVLVADIETKRFVRANATICEMLGYSEDELLSRSVMDIHPVADLPTVQKAFQAQVEGRLIFYENAPVLRKDGRVFYADIGAKAIIYDGRPSAIGIFRDITERKQAQEALERERRTLKHLLQSSDRERQLIAYEIHDGLAQHLAGALMQFETYDHIKEAKPKDAARAFDAGITMLRQGHFETRRLIAGVRPPILDESGVVPAIAHLVNEQTRHRRPKIEFRSKVDFDRLVPILENAIYRIIQEGLTNASRHSRSEKVRVSLLQQEDRVRIEVRDWGIGFEPKNVKEGCFGIAGIRERARLLGGKCSIRSTSGKGTRIRVDLPVMPKE